MQITYSCCDICYDVDEIEEKAYETTTIMINSKAIQLELCTKHRAELEAVTLPYFSAGRRVAPEAGKVKVEKSVRRNSDNAGPFRLASVENMPPTACPECGKVYTVLNGFYMHLNRAHNIEKPSLRYPAEDYRVQVVGESAGASVTEPDPFLDGESPLERKRRRDRERYYNNREVKNQKRRERHARQVAREAAAKAEREAHVSS